MRILIMGMVLWFLSACTKEGDSPVVNIEQYNCNTELTNSHPDSSRFQSFIENKVDEGLVGISMLIATREGIWTGGAGRVNLLSGIKMQSCSLHKVGSISKMMTAAIILQLYEDGSLNIEDKLSDYLNDRLLAKVPNGREVTISQLLNHSSGIPDFFGIAYSLDYLNHPTRLWSDEEELRYIFNDDPNFEVGTKVEYSNSNYILLGMVAKSITGLSASALIQQYISDPLNMYDTSLSANGVIPEGLVHGYFDESGKGDMIDITDLRANAHSMGGGVVSTVEDLYKFIKAWFGDRTLFTQSTMDLIMEDVNIPFADPSEFFFGDNYKVRGTNKLGLGWFELDTQYGKAYGHNGGFNGRRARMWYFPDHDAYIIFMINCSGESVNSISRELFRNGMIELLLE